MKKMSYLCKTFRKKNEKKKFFEIRYLSVLTKVVLRNHDSLIKVIGRIWSLNKPRKWDKVNVLC